MQVNEGEWALKGFLETRIMPRKVTNQVDALLLDGGKQRL